MRRVQTNNTFKKMIERVISEKKIRLFYKVTLKRVDFDKKVRKVNSKI